MSTKSMTDIRTQALKSIQQLSRTIIPMLLVDKSISKQTMDIVTKPMNAMEWSEKDRYATELITILKTSETEMQILQRAEKVRAELNIL